MGAQFVAVSWLSLVVSVLLTLPSTSLAAVGTYNFGSTTDVICFTAFGSWGTANFLHRTLAESLSLYHHNCPNIPVQLMLGDNLIPTAPNFTFVDNLLRHRLQTYHRFGASMADSFIRDSMQVQTLNNQYVMALGDQDYAYGSASVDALIEAAAHDHFGAIHLPSKYHTYLFDTVQHRPTIRVVVLDTLDFTAAQQQWLENTLSRAQEDYVIVMGHYPVVSGGPYGDVMSTTTLPTLLEEYDVTAYFSGHDHSLQHLVQNGVNYFVSGSLGVTPTPTSYKAGITQYHASINGFLGCEASRIAGTMVCELRDCDNNILHSVTLPKRSHPYVGRPPHRCVSDTAVLSGPDVAELEAQVTHLFSNTTDFILLKP